MLKTDIEIHFPDRTVDHPITAGKLIPLTGSVWKHRLPTVVGHINVPPFGGAISKLVP